MKKPTTHVVGFEFLCFAGFRSFPRVWKVSLPLWHRLAFVAIRTKYVSTLDPISLVSFHST